MTRDEILQRMGWAPTAKVGLYDLLDRIERIIRAAEQAEREECAALCERFANRMMSAEECADAIRAGSEP
jgi:hypothetical protein